MRLISHLFFYFYVIHTVQMNRIYSSNCMKSEPKPMAFKGSAVRFRSSPQKALTSFDIKAFSLYSPCFGCLSDASEVYFCILLLHRQGKIQGISAGDHGEQNTGKDLPPGCHGCFVGKNAESVENAVYNDAGHKAPGPAIDHHEGKSDSHRIHNL